MKKIIFIMQFIFFSITAWSLNFSIAPTKFEADLSKTTNHEAYLINNTSKPLRIKVYTETPKSYENYNLNENITIFPKMISIKPGAKQEIRFRVKPSENMEDGEYRSFLVFKEMPGEIKKETADKTEELITDLKVVTEVAVNVFGEIGNIETAGEIKKFNSYYKGGLLYMNAEVLSKGNTALKINYTIKSGNKKLAEGRFGISLRTGESRIEKEVPLDTAELKLKDLKIILSEQNGKILYEEKIN